MVATEGDESWQSLSVLCWSLFLCICCGLAGEESIVTFFDLVQGPGIVVSADISVSAGSECKREKEKSSEG